MMGFQKEIGERLRAERIKRNLSREKVAHDNAVSISAIAMYENGNRMPRDEVKVRLAKYFELPIDFFYPNLSHNVT